jgi:protein-tyrosine phosphatase
VLSLTEVFENTSPGYLIQPITPTQFSDAGIAFYQIPAPDFGTIPLPQIEFAVSWLESKLTAGNSIYVHCKSGRGRSALVLMCYLVKVRNMTAQEAFNFVKSKRKQATVGKESSKWTTLKEFERKYYTPPTVLEEDDFAASFILLECQDEDHGVKGTQ